jgi:MFS family permease
LIKKPSLENQPVGYLALIRGNRNFRSLWIGEVVSLFGDWFNLIASASLIALLTGSGLAVGGLFVVRMLAPFLVSPFAGVAADRFNRKWLLICSDISRAVIVLGFLLVRDARHAWLLYAITAIQLSISGFFIPARNAIFPNILKPTEIGAANALSSATWSVMLALGSALGGVVAGQWGIYPAFIVDSVTFLFSATCIYRIMYVHTPEPIHSEKIIQAFYGQYLDGLRYLKEHTDILVTTLHKGALALTMNGVFQVIQVSLAEQVFVIGKEGGTSLGILYAVSGIGTGLGPIIVRKFTGDRERPLMVVLAFSYIISTIGLAIIAQLSSFPIVLIGSFIRAAGGGLNWVFSTQILFQLIPNRVRGRVFSTEFALMTLTNAISAGVGGWAYDHTTMNISEILWFMAFLTLIPGALWALWLISHSKIMSPSILENEPVLIDPESGDRPISFED